MLIIVVHQNDLVLLTMAIPNEILLSEIITFLHNDVHDKNKNC